MTDVAVPSPPAGARAIAGQSPALAPPHAGEGRRKHVNTQATSRSLRHLAREAAERGERLVEISRRLQISPSTIHHWAKADGFRRKDIKARASLSAGPVMPGKADYPELKDMAPRARLERLHELSGMARLRAIAAVEEGFVDYGLKWLREAQKLERAGRALQEYLEDYPPPEEEASDDYVWDQLDEDAQAEIEGRAPRLLPPPPETGDKAEDARIDAAIEAARMERMMGERGGQAPTPEEISEDRLANFLADLREFARLKEEVKKWRLLPGRGDPPPIRAVSRGRNILEHPSPARGRGAGGEGAQQRGPDTALDAESAAESPSFVAREIAGRFPDPSDPPTPSPQGWGEGAKSGGPRLYGIEDAFPVRFPVRRE